MKWKGRGRRRPYGNVATSILAASLTSFHLVPFICRCCAIGSDWIRLDRTGLDRTGLDWIGMDWTGSDWIGLDWIGHDWTGLDWIGLDWIGLDSIRLDMIWLDWIRLDRIGLDWTGLDWTGLDWVRFGWIGFGWIGLDLVGFGWIGLDLVELDWIGRHRPIAVGGWRILQDWKGSGVVRKSSSNEGWPKRSFRDPREAFKRRKSLLKIQQDPFRAEWILRERRWPEKILQKSNRILQRWE